MEPPRGRKLWYSMRRLMVGVGVFLALVGLLWVLFVPMDITGVFNKSKETAAYSDARELSAALYAYRVNNGKYPRGGDSVIFRELTGRGADKKVYIDWRPKRLSLKDERFLDPWGTPYRIQIEGEKVSVSSAGRDRKFAAEGQGNDVVFDWQQTE